MNCQDFENHVNDLWREQIMDAGVRAHAIAHRDECEACAQRLEDERALSFRLRALAADAESAEMPPLGDRLLIAFRNQQLAMRQPAAAYQAYQSLYWAAAAAVVLAVIAISVFRLATPVTQPPARPSSAAGLKTTPVREIAIAKGPEMVVSSGAAASLHKNVISHSRSITGRIIRRDLREAVMPAARVTRIAKVARPKTTPIVATKSGTTEIATDFIPVGYASAANLQDGGQIVRVELPRSALLAFGLPMNVNRYHEKVKADVFFGADGTARAIRFVQ
jgi:hypothetical protein